MSGHNLTSIDSESFSQRILSLLNLQKPKDFIFADTVTLIQQETGIDSIGLRLNDGSDYPYYVTKGFSDGFVEMENFLCARDKHGNTIKGPDGLPELECMCGNIIRGRTDATLPYFTPKGSFWTNSTTELLADQAQTKNLGTTRNRCNKEGYESVALIPIRDVETYGLLQLNHRRKGLYTLKFIELMEWVASSIGILISYLLQQEQPESFKDVLEKYQPHRVIGPIKSRE